MWVCVALTAGVSSGYRAPPTLTGQQEPLPPTSGDSLSGHLLPGPGAVSTVGEEMKLLIAMVFEICSFQGISGIRNEILALISHICWVLRP